MGGGTFHSSSTRAAYAAFTTASVGKATHDIYTSRTIDPYLDPLGVKLRESRDSADNPRSTPIIIGLDVTGSMGIICSSMTNA